MKDSLKKQIKERLVRVYKSEEKAEAATKLIMEKEISMIHLIFATGVDGTQTVMWGILELLWEFEEVLMQ